MEHRTRLHRATRSIKNPRHAAFLCLASIVTLLTAGCGGHVTSAGNSQTLPVVSQTPAATTVAPVAATRDAQATANAQIDATVSPALTATAAAARQAGLAAGTATAKALAVAKPSPAPSASPPAVGATDTPAATTVQGGTATAVATPDIGNFATWHTGAIAGPYPVSLSFDPTTGQYRIALTDASQFYDYQVYAPGSLYFANFTLSVDLSRVAGPPGGYYGVMVRAQPRAPQDKANAHFNVLIVPDMQQFSVVWTSAANTATVIAPKAVSQAIHKDNTGNHLVVTCQADKLSVAINGTTLGTYPATFASTGTIGLEVINPLHPSGPVGMEAAFSNLRVTAVP